jgi:hypothetical protein
MRGTARLLGTILVATTTLVVTSAASAHAATSPLPGLGGLGGPPGGGVVMTSPLPGLPATPATDLIRVAEAAIAAKNTYLVNGRSDATPPAAYGAWLASIRPELDDRRTGLTAASLAYTSQSVLFSHAAVTVDGSVATVVADVESRFGMTGTGGNTGVPPVTAGGEQLHFTFSAATGEWVLDHVDTDDVGGAYYQPDTPPVSLAAAVHAPAAVPVADADSPVVADPEAALPALVGLDLPIPPDDSSNRKRANRDKVVAYAVAHSGVNGHPYNTGAYHTFKNDCTNFVSQSVEDGGWPETQTSSYDPTKAWWYLAANDYVTSWTSAEHFYWFVDDNGWAPKRKTLSSFRPGDIMQAKPPKYHPERVGHSMVVTARDGKGNLFLTYHTGNYENTPYVDFYNRARSGGTGPTIYGWNVG